jgi:hypothetical protein
LYSILHAFFSSEAAQRPATQLYHLFNHNLRQAFIYNFFVLKFQHNVQLYFIHLFNNIHFTTHKDRTNTFDVPRPDLCGQHTIHIELPLIRDLISSKLNQLPSRHRLGFIEKLSHYGTEVGKACSVIKQTLQQIVEKQYNLSDVFGELIDEVLRAESEDNDDGYDVQQPTKKSDDILPHSAG